MHYLIRKLVYLSSSTTNKIRSILLGNHFNKVKDYGLLKWKQGMGNKSTLKMYSEKVAPRKKLFYSGNKGSSLLFKTRTNSLEANDRTYRFNESRETICKMCNMQVEETSDHLLAECPTFPPLPY